MADLESGRDAASESAAQRRSQKLAQWFGALGIGAGGWQVVGGARGIGGANGEGSFGSAAASPHLGGGSASPKNWRGEAAAVPSNGGRRGVDHTLAK